jgi:hypothetical protein
VIRYNVHTAVGNADALGNKNFMLHGRAHDWPWQGVTLAAHLTRLLSVLLGAATVAFTCLIALPGFPWLAGGSHAGDGARRLFSAIPFHFGFNQQRQPGHD